MPRDAVSRTANVERIHLCLCYGMFIVAKKKIGFLKLSRSRIFLLYTHLFFSGKFFYAFVRTYALSFFFVSECVMRMRH